MIHVIFIVPILIKSTMRIRICEEIRQYSVPLTALIILICTVSLSDAVRAAAFQSLSRCINVIIPCIFPVTVTAFFILEVGFPVKVKNITHFALVKMFGLSGSCLEGIFLGLTGGYNTAVKCAVKLHNDNIITAEEARRLGLFFTNPGLSFTVILTGSALYGDILCGLRLYTETLLLNIISAYLYNKAHKNTADTVIIKKDTAISKAFVSSVDSSAAAVLSISFNIMFFSCIVGILERLVPLNGLIEILRLTGEVSSAVVYSSSMYPFYITSGILSFGGFCIFIQNLGDLKTLNIKPSEFIFIRLFHSASVIITEYILSLIFPESVCASLSYQVKFTSSADLIGSLALIFLCAVYLFSVRAVKVRAEMTKKVH